MSFSAHHPEALARSAGTAGFSRLVRSPSGYLGTAVRILVVSILLLQVLAWSWQRGYPVADAVEFMDRAADWVQGEALRDGRSVRSFAFSALFVPLFGAARAFGLEDTRVLLPIARLMQMGIGLALVLAVVRLGSRFGGRSVGLAAGWVCAVNPVFLEFSVQPVSGLAAALCVALGLDALADRERPRSSWIAGTWLGLAFLMAYQCLVVALAVLLFLFARERWRHRSRWIAVGGCLAAAMLVQIGLDRVFYGTWGGSLGRYLLLNAGSIVPRFLYDVGLEAPARRLYAFQVQLLGGELRADTASLTPAQIQERTWYLTHATRMFAVPVLLLLAAGIAASLRRPRAALLLSFVLLLNFAVLTSKAAKSLRLLLPLLPMVAPLCALGWASLRGPPSSWLRRARLASILLVLALPLSLRSLKRADLQVHGGYWDAIDAVNAHARAAGGRPQRVACAYPWAVFLRAAPGVELVKPTYAIERWSSLSEEARGVLAGELAGLDWLIVHLPVLSGQPALLEHINDEFDVRAAWYDQDAYAALGPILLLHERDGTGQRFFRWSDDPPEFRAPGPVAREPVHFMRQTGAGQDRLTFLGCDYAPLPGSGWGWITYHWRADGPLSTDYTIVDRLTGPGDANSWQNNHGPAWGTASTASWPRGRTLSEGYLLVPSAVDWSEGLGFRPLGGAWRRGDLLPVHLWAEIVAGEGESAPRLEPWRPGEPRSVRAGLDPERHWTLDGFRFSMDGLLLLESFFLPVHPRARARDDGRPLPD